MSRELLYARPGELGEVVVCLNDDGGFRTRTLSAQRAIELGYALLGLGLTAQEQARRLVAVDPEQPA